MNLLYEYTPRELAIKTIEDIKKKRDKKRQAEKDFNTFVRNRFAGNLARKNKKRFYR